MAKNKMLQAVVSLAGTIDPSLGKALDDVTGKLENVNWKAVAVGGAVGGIAVATGKAVVEAGKYLADLGNEYNTAINQLSAATGATGDELDAILAHFPPVSGELTDEEQWNAALAMTSALPQRLFTADYERMVEEG